MASLAASTGEEAGEAKKRSDTLTRERFPSGRGIEIQPRVIYNC